jgi:Putative beta barrel porin-7 (BBP7)
MKVFWVKWLPTCTFLALMAVSIDTKAQTPMPAGAMPGAAPQLMGAPPMMQGGPGGAYSGGPYEGGAPSYAPPVMGQGDYATYGGDSAMMGGGGYEGAAGGCPDGSCGPGGPYRGLLGDFLGLVGPDPDGGCGAPRWYDVSIEGMWLKRDDAGRNIDVTTRGIGGPVVLSTNDIAFEDRPSFRLNAWIQFKSAGNLEFTYYGLFHWNDQAQATDAGSNLYSAYSQFGSVPFGGFLEDGQADYQRIEYSSTFDNLELNYRRHWQGAGARYQGSWLFGARHFNLDEDFNFISVSSINSAQMRTVVDVNNALTGGQIGGDVWVCIVPGLRMGMEGKVGVFGNHCSQGTELTATTLANRYLESVTHNDVSFVADAQMMMTYRLNYQFNLKFAYNFLFAEGVALASENFNVTPPDLLLNGSNRTAQLNDNGDIFYHGASIGLEYNW